MPDKSSSEKTEKPTSKKLRDARKKGQVSKSADVVSTALLLGMFLLFLGFGMRDFGELAQMAVLPSEHFQESFSDALSQLTAIYLVFFLVTVLPFLVVAIAVGIFANFLQIGPVFSVDPMIPKFEKLNPFEGAKKLVSLKNLIEFVKNVLKMVVLGVMVFLVARSMIEPTLVAPSGGLQNIFALIGPMMKRFMWPIIIVYIAFAMADYFFQKYNFLREMKMTKDEVKREFKESEGNPEIKGKRKQMAREIALSDATENTRKATVLITNPTHYAVALNYQSGKKTLPQVTAKGEGYIAQRMIEVAREEGIPVMRNVTLARELYSRVELNHYIPDDMLEPVAEVIKWVRKVKKDADRVRDGE